MQIHRLGSDALLVELPDTATATALYRTARSRGLVVRDLVPAARTVLFDGPDDLAGLLVDLPAWDLEPGAVEPTGPVVEVPTRYDGPDLADVARLWDMTADEVVRTHTGAHLVVAFCGFAPGFAYCTGLPAGLEVPRLHDPRATVTAGSVGLAGAFTGVYPTASPGGWRIIGRTELDLWHPDRDEPATLPPGARVRFVEV